jgi:undecaprenyl-diphosphatase
MMNAASCLRSSSNLAQFSQLCGNIASVSRVSVVDAVAQRFLINIAIAFMPLAILGLIFGKAIKAHLFQPVPVALALIIGGFIILWAEKRDHKIRVENIEDLSMSDAVKLGFAQAVALIPGTSRSGSTIIGGLLFGLSRKAATEFSFFLAIPTLTLATIYQIYKERHLLTIDDLGMWVVGFVAAFFSAFLCVRWLLRFISNHDFTPFAWYRIAFGCVVLATWHWGIVDWTS